MDKILKTDADRLLYESIIELAEQFGHNLENPLSLGLLCIIFNVSYEQKGNILVEFSQIAENIPHDELEISLFRDVMVKHCQDLDNMPDIVLKAFIKAYAKLYIAKLYPFAMSLSTN